MPMIDLHPAAERMTQLIEATPDEALGAPTPSGCSVETLIDHISGFARAFVAAAAKDLGELTAQPGAAESVDLEPGWRGRLAEELVALATAWDAPDAWEGMTQAGGVDLPGDVAGGVALDELVVHGWDLARATGQPYDCDAETLGAVEAMVREWRADDDGEIPGLFGPVVPVPAGEPPLHQVLGLTGRDPAWSPPD
jgi:uncharacterized protein (TIGR03086 family)